jgi:hypothetical protein
VVLNVLQQREPKICFTIVPQTSGESRNTLHEGASRQPTPLIPKQQYS